MDLTRYAHGLGFGGINGDGRNDIINRVVQGCESLMGSALDSSHQPFELDGAQMLVYDVDGDEDNDIVLQSHPTDTASPGWSTQRQK